MQNLLYSHPQLLKTLNKMKKMMWLPVALLTAGALFVGCQKQLEDELSNNDDARAARSVNRYSAESCQTCIDTWSESNEDLDVLPADAEDYDVDIEVEQDGNMLSKLLVTIADGDGFTKMAYEVKYVSADGNTTKDLLRHYDANAGGGEVTSRNLFLKKDGSAVVNGEPGSGNSPSSINDPMFPEGWSACDKIEISIVEINGAGVTNTTVLKATYYLFELSCGIDGNDFTAQTGRTVEYTFGSEEGVDYFKMQGGLNNFTGENATVYVNDELVVFDQEVIEGASTWITGYTANGYEVGQRTPGGSSNRNIRVIGGVGTCSAVTVKIIWNTDNTGSTITGDWSVKDINGVELAPEVPGLECNQ